MVSSDCGVSCKQRLKQCCAQRARPEGVLIVPPEVQPGSARFRSSTWGLHGILSDCGVSCKWRQQVRCTRCASSFARMKSSFAFFSARFRSST